MGGKRETNVGDKLEFHLDDTARTHKSFCVFAGSAVGTCSETIVALSFRREGKEREKRESVE